MTSEEKKTSEEAVEKTTTEETTVEEVKVEVPEKFKTLVEQIEKMNVLDLAELVKILEEKFGVSSAAPAVAMAPAGGEAVAEVEEKTEFDVELTDMGSNKIGVIKAIRAVSDMGLKDAKELAEAAPKMVKEGVKKEDAEEMKAKLEEAGAKVTLK